MRKRTLALAGIFAAAATAVIALRPTPEPSHLGTPLHTWAHIYYSNFFENPDSKETAQAAEAIRAMGNQALPPLLHWIQYEEKPWRQKVATATHALPFSKPLVTALERPQSRALDAEQAFTALGEQASNAVPTLVKLLRQPGAPNISMRAYNALTHTGQSALYPLLSVLADSNAPNRELAAGAISLLQGLSKQSAEAAVQSLLPLLNHSNVFLSLNAVGALGNLATLPDQVVPALTSQLSNPEPSMRYSAALALSKFGTNAAAAIPALLAWPTQPSLEVSAVMRDALLLISHTNEETSSTNRVIP